MFLPNVSVDSENDCCSQRRDWFSDGDISKCVITTTTATTYISSSWKPLAKTLDNNNCSAVFLDNRCSTKNALQHQGQAPADSLDKPGMLIDHNKPPCSLLDTMPANYASPSSYYQSLPTSSSSPSSSSSSSSSFSSSLSNWLFSECFSTPPVNTKTNAGPSTPPTCLKADLHHIPASSPSPPPPPAASPPPPSHVVLPTSSKCPAAPFLLERHRHRLVRSLHSAYNQLFFTHSKFLSSSPSSTASPSSSSSSSSPLRLLPPPPISSAALSNVVQLLFLLLLLLIVFIHPTSACYKYPTGVRDPCETQACTYGAVCRSSIDGKTARCECPRECATFGDSVGSKPVCGNDGKDYPNMCALKFEACYSIKEIRVKYYGKCDPCEGYKCEAPMTCHVAANREPECQCNYVCFNDINLVCGSDGKTYSNQCVLKKQACKSGRDLRVSHQGKCSPENNPCSKLKCGPEEECTVDRKGKAACVCPPRCEPVLRTVCGNDSTTYDNKCELRRQACLNKVHVAVDHQGPCNAESPCSQTRCGYGAVCVVMAGGKASCQCPQCSEEYNPVCGENGITYENECKLRQENCHREENVMVKKKGTCDDCGHSRCEFYASCDGSQGEPKCVCPTTCVKVHAPVCGSDGATYENECELRVQSCRKKVFLAIASKGSCDKCKNVVCKFSARCENGVCMCPIMCPTVREPVCASNQNSYINECEMRRTACAKSIDLQVVSAGECDSDSLEMSGSGDECQCNVHGSYSTTCDPETRQCTCKPGVGGKTCNRCQIGYWGMHLIEQRGISGCMPCQCHKSGSQRDDCDQMTGRCVCNPTAMGMKCDQCRNGKKLGPEGCINSKQPTTCAEMECKYGTCEMTGSGPICRCLQDCDVNTRNSEMVCGSDGQTFGSQCMMEEFACRMKHDLYVQYSGPCKGGPPTAMTTASPVTKSRKTTRHISPEENMNNGNGGNPRDKDDDNKNKDKANKDEKASPEEKCDGGNINDLCISDENCCPNNSYCHGLCYCKDGFIPSLDNTQCFKLISNPTKNDSKVTDACSDGDLCEPGSTCVPDDFLGYRCACPLGKAGPHCNKNIDFENPSFSGRSHLQLPHIAGASQDLSIDIVFSSLNQDGIILFNTKLSNGTGDFVSISVKGGFVEFRFDLGGGPAILRSKNPIEPKKSHRVIARRSKEMGELIVNNEDPVQGSSPSTHSLLDLNDPLFLGYIPNVAKAVYEKVGVDLGLVGCIYSLRAGSTNSMYTYSLASDAPYPDVIKGVDITECGKNPCKSIPCLNGATCLVLDTQIFECRCREGYKGQYCEKLVNPCASEPCQYGGTCLITSSSEGFFCQCPHGREGTRCERELIPQLFVPLFTGDSYMQMPLEDRVSHTLSITVWFKTLSPNGVLFFATQSPGGRGDFISLNIKNKKLIFKFFLGTETGQIESLKHVHLDKWHEVTVTRTGKEGQMSIDGHAPVRGTAGLPSGFGGSASILNIDNRPLYVGGFNSTDDLPFRAGIENGLTGAIQRIIINGRTIDGLMASALTMSNISPYNGAPCNVNPCMNDGVCIPMLNRVECRCPADFVGKNCEKRYDRVDKDQPLQFDGLTALSYPNEVSRNQKGQQSNSFKVLFRTSEPDGVLLLQRGGDSALDDYLSLAISGGYAEFSYNLGKQDPGNLHIIRSLEKVNDGTWHMVTVQRHQRKGTLQVDDEEEVVGSSLEGTKQLDTDGLLWVGGLSNLPWYLPTTKNFVGCIDKVEVNSLKLHLLDDKYDRSASVAFCT